MNEAKEWLDSLKVGSSVILTTRNTRYLRKVVRVTATLFVLNTGERIRRKDGSVVGGTPYSTTSISPATEEVVASVSKEMRQRGLSSRLAGVSWRSLPLETLEAVYALLPKE